MSDPLKNDGLRCSGLRPGNRCVHGFRASVAGEVTVKFWGGGVERCLETLVRHAARALALETRLRVWHPSLPARIDRNADG